MSLKIEWVWEEELCDLHPSGFEPESTPVIRLDELRWWLEARAQSLQANGLHTCIDDLLVELAALRRA